MHKFPIMFSVILLLPHGLAFAADVGSPSPSNGLNYFCDPENSKCYCEGKSDCEDMLDSRECKTPEGVPDWNRDPEGIGLDFTHWLTCDEANYQCTCNYVYRVRPDGTSVQLNPTSTGTEMAPTQSAPPKKPGKVSVTRDGVLMAPDEPNSTESLVNALAKDGRFTFNKLENKDNQGEKSSGISLASPMQVIPNSTTSSGNYPSNGVVAPPISTPSPNGLKAPSSLAISNIARTSLTLSWRDNSTTEFGVEVHRVDPLAARMDPSINWTFLMVSEERVSSNVSSIGMRSDEDFDLTPGTNYCYRLRAYKEFSRTEVSNFSNPVCAQTLP